MPHRFVIADVFTEKVFGGNQLAVFPDAQGLSDRALQALAREFNFAETTFVLPPQDARHACRVRIFTPKIELPFAGHPTVGTAAVLARLGLIVTPGGVTTVVFEEGIGPVTVEIRLRGTATFTRLAIDKEIETGPTGPAPKAAAAALSLPEETVLEAWFASAGVPFCFIRLVSKQAVDRAALDRTAWSANFARAWSPNLFLFAGDLSPGSRLYARMFAPAFGIEEDPARPPARPPASAAQAEPVAGSSSIPNAGANMRA